MGSGDDPSSPLDVSVPQECSCQSTSLAVKKKRGVGVVGGGWEKKK